MSDTTDTYYEDKELICEGCKRPFVFTGGEQRFFAEKGFTPPKRCKPCRDKRKQQRAANTGNGNGRGARDQGPPQSYEEVWATEDDFFVRDDRTDGGSGRRQRRRRERGDRKRR